MDLKTKKELKNKLSQLNDIRKEIIELEKKIKKLENRGIFKDLVEASSKYFPYTKYNVSIEAQNPKIAQKLELYKNVLKSRLDELVDLKIEIEMFFNNLPTSRLRRIFELKYINQYTWQKIAYIMGGASTQDSIRKEHDRFFEKI